jgi:phenylacetyl-CoA:acceptor oxidoreductase
MAAGSESVVSYCYNCVNGPDLFEVKVSSGIAVGIEPCHAAAKVPIASKPCVKVYGLIQKTYNPYRILTPMKRTNPRKGVDQDPRFVPISWDEALDTIAAKLGEIRALGLVDDQGLPRVAASFGHGGTPTYYMGTFPAFLAAWGPIDFSFGSGQGTKCRHNEHLYGEYWHRGFTVCPDTPLTRYVLSFGDNVEVTGGVSGVIRHADARVRGAKRVQVEPHLSVAAACSAEWIPIKPKTDAAFLFAMLHVLVHEEPRGRLDVPFLRDRTASPYLIGPNGFYLRDPQREQPFVWDGRSGAAQPLDVPGVEPVLEGRFLVAEAVEIGPDDERHHRRDVEGETEFSRLAEHLLRYTPEWAERVCDVPAATIRRIAVEYLDHACVGETTEIDGVVLPFRPVAVTLGKTVNNGWGSYECCWARTMLAALVGALETPGGTLGTCTRLNRPHQNRVRSVVPGPDGFMKNTLNATDVEHWLASPSGRNAHDSLVPLLLNAPGWSQALGPTQLAWLFQRDPPEGWPKPTLPDLWFVFRTNPPISFCDGGNLSDTMSRMPFVVCFAYTRDETNHMADVLLPEATDLESLQLMRLGGTKFQEYFWENDGFVLRRPAVAPRGQAKDFTWISTELARRTGLGERYVAAINHGAGVGTPLSGEGYDFSLDARRPPGVEEIWDAACKAATASLSEGREVRDLAWFTQHGFYTVPFPRLDWYLYPTMVEKGLRFELPYQERLMRAGQELGRRLHDHGIRWWDAQLAEYTPLPEWQDVPGRWEQALRHAGAEPSEYPFWMLTTKSMQYHCGGNVSIQLMHEVSQNVRGHGGIVINARTAREQGIASGDPVEVSSPFGSTRGAAILAQGIRPDTLLAIGQFQHWATPYAKDIAAPSMNCLVPMSLELTDSAGSGADVMRVKIRRVADGHTAQETKP